MFVFQILTVINRRILFCFFVKRFCCVISFKFHCMKGSFWSNRNKCIKPFHLQFLCSIFIFITDTPILTVAPVDCLVDLLVPFSNRNNFILFECFCRLTHTILCLIVSIISLDRNFPVVNVLWWC